MTQIKNHPVHKLDSKFDNLYSSLLNKLRKEQGTYNVFKIIRIMFEIN